MLDHAFRRAAEKDMFKAAAPVSRHHDEIGGKFPGEPADFVERRRAAQKMAVCSGQPVFISQRTEFADESLFLVLLVCNE